jgi:tRNA A-37 threonylcarbamoyl transferase component Bud32
MSPCPSQEELLALLAGHLAEAPRAAVEAHVEECTTCQGRLEKLTQPTEEDPWPLPPPPSGAGWPLPSDSCLDPLLALPPTEGSSEAMPAAQDRKPPQVAGYEIVAEIGRGGMGVVYKARHQQLKRPVALKMILTGSHAAAPLLARFRREAEAVARLQHPHIVQIYEIGEQDGLPYLCLELVEGRSLAQQLAGGPLPPRSAAQLLETVARAVHYAHQSGIIHRDLKPANILLAFSREPSARADGALAGGSRLNECVPKITDFGLAKQLTDQTGPTSTGAILGTPRYMAPEQAAGRNQEVGPPTDVYALGAILYETLTGRPPFGAATPLETALQVVSQEPVPPTVFQPQVPRDLETICLKCLHKEPRKRYAAAADLAEDLHHFLEGRPIQARRSSWVERAWRWGRRNPALAIVGGLAVCGLLAITILALIFWVRESAHAGDLATALDRAQSEQRLAEERRWIADRQTALMAMDRGLNECEQGEIGQGLVWLAHSLRLAQQLDDPPLERFIRLSLAAWSRQNPHLQACVSHPHWVFGIRLSRDGCRAASLHALSRTVACWNTATGEPLFPPLVHPGLVCDAAFCPDGRFLLTAAEPDSVHVWNLATGDRVGELPPLPERVYGVAFSPDGKSFLSRSLTAVRLWETATRQGYPVFYSSGPDSRGRVQPGRQNSLYRRRQAGIALGGRHRQGGRSRRGASGRATQLPTESRWPDLGDAEQRPDRPTLGNRLGQAARPAAAVSEHRRLLGPGLPRR